MYTWTCELCAFVSDSPEATDIHRQTALHSDEQVAAYNKALNDSVVAATAPHVPEDMDSVNVNKRAALVLMSTNTSRTTALALIQAGAIRGTFTGLSKSQILGMMEATYDALMASEFVHEIRKQYTEANQAAKAAQQMQSEAGSPLIMAPKTDIVH